MVHLQLAHVYNSGVTSITAGSSATLRWTVSNGSCTDATDDVQITNNNNPTANAGNDVTSVGCQYIFECYASGGSGGSYSFSWTPSTGLDDANIAKQLESFFNGDYTVQILDQITVQQQM